MCNNTEGCGAFNSKGQFKNLTNCLGTRKHADCDLYVMKHEVQGQSLPNFWPVP